MLHLCSIIKNACSIIILNKNTDWTNLTLPRKKDLFDKLFLTEVIGIGHSWILIFRIEQTFSYRLMYNSVKHNRLMSNKKHPIHKLFDLLRHGISTHVFFKTVQISLLFQFLVIKTVSAPQYFLLILPHH